LGLPGVMEIDLGHARFSASLVFLSAFLPVIGTLLAFPAAPSDQGRPSRRRQGAWLPPHLLEFRLFMDEPRLILKAPAAI